jgi:hypothetical protein
MSIQIALATARSPIRIARRNLVSSVLLTRTWENESVAELKRQAKTRGLSPYVRPSCHVSNPTHYMSRKGNKATLIQKIQEHDKSNVHGTVSARDPPVAVAARDMSTSSTLRDQGIAPGIPSMTHPIQDSGQHFMVNIPDIPQPAPEFSVQVVCTPFVPIHSRIYPSSLSRMLIPGIISAWIFSSSTRLYFLSMY